MDKIWDLSADKAALKTLQSDNEGLLASVIMFDQFTRNIFRGKPESFAFDNIALEAAQRLVDSGAYHSFHPAAQCFVFLVYLYQYI